MLKTVLIVRQKNLHNSPLITTHTRAIVHSSCTLTITVLSFTKLYSLNFYTTVLLYTCPTPT